MLANYEADDELQRNVTILKQPYKYRIQKLPAPWWEDFSTFSLDPNDYLYIDDRVVVPKTL